MHVSWTFSRYFSRQFLYAVGVAFLASLAIIFLADFVELLRRTSTKEEVSIGIVLSMALLRLPSLGWEVMPFAVLIGGMASLLRLNRSQELVVARAAGVSVWQFLMPAVFVAFFIGVIAVTVYNPVAATLVSQFGQLETKYIKGRASLLSVAQTGFWLRESGENGKSVVHALRGSSTDGIELQDVIIFRYTDDNVLSGTFRSLSTLLRRRAFRHGSIASIFTPCSQVRFCSPQWFWSPPLFPCAFRALAAWVNLSSPPFLLVSCSFFSPGFLLRSAAQVSFPQY